MQACDEGAMVEGWGWRTADERNYNTEILVVSPFMITTIAEMMQLWLEMMSYYPAEKTIAILTLYQ